MLLNLKYFDSIHVDTDHTDLNQALTVDSTKNGSIHVVTIRAIEEILLAPLHLVHTPPPVSASPLFLYGRSSDPLSPSHGSSEESLTPKGNHKPRIIIPNPILNVPIDLSSDPSFSYSSSSDSSDS